MGRGAHTSFFCCITFGIGATLFTLSSSAILCATSSIQSRAEPDGLSPGIASVREIT